jgi:hypothetical protein
LQARAGLQSSAGHSGPTTQGTDTTASGAASSDDILHHHPQKEG